MTALLSKALLSAMKEYDRECAEVVPLTLGQNVEVRTRVGTLVALGYIAELNIETGVVRVSDQGSGSDLQIDVDTERYDVWVLDDPGNGADPSETPVQPRLAVHTKKPGAYAGGRY